MICFCATIDVRWIFYFALYKVLVGSLYEDLGKDHDLGPTEIPPWVGN